MKRPYPPLSFLLRRRRPDQPWTPRDYLLVHALELYERSIHDCGESTFLTMHDDYAGHFAVQAAGTCLKCQAIAEFRRRNKDVEPNGAVHVTKFITRGMVDDHGAPFRQEVTDG